MKILLAFILFTLFGFLNPNLIRVHMIGDSTMAVKDTSAYPETGWGMPFSIFFDNTHFSEYGARVMAQLAFAELKKFDLELNNRVTKGR